MEMETSKITKAEMEHLIKFVRTFGFHYSMRTGKPLTSLEQLIGAFETDEFTLEDMYYSHLDQVLQHATKAEDIFWENHMEMFEYQNYFPNQCNKSVDEGAWIKIRTKTGYEVHWARFSNRKIIYGELIEHHMVEIDNYIKKIDFSIATNTIESFQKKVNDHRDIVSELMIRQYISIKPYEVRITRTKSKTEYYLPYQYELVTDEELEHLSSAYVDHVVGVGAKTLYTQDNKDAIFYLTTRGIPKRTAEIMAMLKQMYFTFNMEEALEEYNNQFTKQVTFGLKTV